MDDTNKNQPGTPASDGPATPGKPSLVPDPAQAQGAGSPGADLQAKVDDLTDELKAAVGEIESVNGALESAQAEIKRLETQLAGKREISGAHAAVFKADSDGAIPVEGGGEKLYQAGDYIFAFSDKDFHVLPTHVFRELFNRL